MNLCVIAPSRHPNCYSIFAIPYFAPFGATFPQAASSAANTAPYCPFVFASPSRTSVAPRAPQPPFTGRNTPRLRPHVYLALLQRQPHHPPLLVLPQRRKNPPAHPKIRHPVWSLRVRPLLRTLATPDTSSETPPPSSVRLLAHRAHECSRGFQPPEECPQDWVAHPSPQGEGWVHDDRTQEILASVT